MLTVPLSDTSWTHASYELRVRGTIYLWGSAGILTDLVFDHPLHLHIHNDPFGEKISFGTRFASGVQTGIGTLEPGECVTVPLQKISGVFATCSAESTVRCLIR